MSNWRQALLGDASFETHSQGEWYALINNYVTYQDGSLRIVFAYRNEGMLDNRIASLRDKAERILKRTDFDQEFTKVKITVEKV